MKASRNLNVPAADPLLSVYKSLFFDFSRHGSLREFLSDDFRILARRLKGEGYTFIAREMPRLGKSLDSALITGEPFSIPQGWKVAGETRLPRFLNKVFKALFSDDGVLRPPYEHQEADVFFLRQTLLMFSKMEVPAGLSDQLVDQTDDDALSSWLARATYRWEPPFKDEWFREIVKCTRTLLENLFSDDSYPTIRALREFKRNPWGRHGPGAVADREKGENKWLFKHWPGIPERLTQWSSGKDCPVVGKLPEQPDARACVVPKDFRGPRVICIEPKENQFAQQGLMELLFNHIESHPFSRKSISFVDTRESERLCFDKDVSTIDMKDASDHISLNLARLVLPKWIFQLVTRYRTRHVVVPLTSGATRVRTTSLATMGNATCFPLETLIFWAIARSAMYLVMKSFSVSVRRTLADTCRVFGDDIICPSWACDVVVDALVACGLVVNKEKTCHLSLVKESCGEWVFNDKSVRIVKIKTPACEVKDLRSWLQVRDYALSFRSVGYEATAVTLYELSDGKWNAASFKRRWNPQLQRMEVRVPLFVTQGGKAELVDYQALYAWYVHNDVTPYLLGARKRVKWGWISLLDFEQA